MAATVVLGLILATNAPMSFLAPCRLSSDVGIREFAQGDLGGRKTGNFQLTLKSRTLRSMERPERRVLRCQVLSE